MDTTDNEKQKTFVGLARACMDHCMDPVAGLDLLYQKEYGILPVTDGRDESEELQEYRANYLEGKRLRESHFTAQQRESGLADLACELVREGCSEPVSKETDYQRYVQLFSQGLACWEKTSRGEVVFYPSRSALVEMCRMHASEEKRQVVPPTWGEAKRKDLAARFVSREALLLYGCAVAWCIGTVMTIIWSRTGGLGWEVAVGISLLVGFSVLMWRGYVGLHPESRDALLDRFFTKANTTVMLSGLVVPLLASMFIQDYRLTQVQADLTQALMTHIGAERDERELSSTQIALMVDLINANSHSFGLDLSDFQEKLSRAEQDLAKQRAADEEAKTQQLRDEKASLAAQIAVGMEHRRSLTDEENRVGKRVLTFDRKIAAIEDKGRRQSRSEKLALKNLEEERERVRERLKKTVSELKENGKTAAEQKTKLAAVSGKIDRIKTDLEAMKSSEDFARESSGHAKQAAKAARERDEKQMLALAEELGESSERLTAAIGREQALRTQTDVLRDKTISLEKQVRKTAQYFSHRATVYLHTRGNEVPDPSALVEKTSTQAAEALQALEDSQVVLSTSEKQLKKKMEALKTKVTDEKDPLLGF